MVINSLEGLLFLTYLTKYNIKHIYQILDSDHYNDLEHTVEAYLIRQNNGNEVDSGAVKTAFKSTYAETMLAIEKLKYNGIKAISIFDKHYPRQLMKIADKPPIIYYKGILKDTDLAAIVGSRKISNNAATRTTRVVEILSDHHYGVISGLALGIDKLAHEIALARNCYTISVLPVSLDNIYPVAHYKLANDIIERKGCLISEIPIGINRGKKSFVERNRIIAALSTLVIPIEMGINSGTMHTINYALRYDKDLFLLKPSENDSHLTYYEGINFLIDKHQDRKNNQIHIIPVTSAFKEALNKIARTNTLGVQGSLF